MLGILAALSVAADGVLRSATPRFYPDDPRWEDADRVMDASSATPIEDTNGYDFVVNTFMAPGERRDVRALNVNTVDEVPDSSWFTNRIGRGAATIDEVVRGPDRLERIAAKRLERRPNLLTSGSRSDWTAALVSLRRCTSAASPPAMATLTVRALKIAPSFTLQFLRDDRRVQLRSIEAVELLSQSDDVDRELQDLFKVAGGAIVAVDVPRLLAALPQRGRTPVRVRVTAIDTEKFIHSNIVELRLE